MTETPDDPDTGQEEESADAAESHETPPVPGEPPGLPDDERGDGESDEPTVTGAMDPN